MTNTPTQLYEFGPFRVDPLRRVLMRDGNQVRLPAKAFEILMLLLEEKGRLVEKDELLRRVWPEAVVEENNLTVNISALRRALAESPGEHRYVVTVPGRGYQFVAEVNQLDATTNHSQVNRSLMPDQSSVLNNALSSEVRSTESSADEERLVRHPIAVPQNPHVRKNISQYKNVIVLCLVGLVAAAIIITFLIRSRHTAVKSPSTITSLAVLPFVNETGDPNAEYLSEGIPESLINSLSQLPGVKVIARSSAFKYKNTGADINEVAKALGVDAVLLGRVKQREENLSISVELVNASDKTQVWGQQYERKMSDLLAIQHDIAREIVENLKPRVSTEGKTVDRDYTKNGEAYQLYLKGRFYWNKRTAEGIAKSIEYFNQAIAKDPDFALAYAGIADSYVVPANQLAPRDAMPKAKAAATRALELDETLAEAHVSLGRVFAAFDWNWTGAEKEFKRAIELNPNYATAHQWYGGYLTVMGRREEAIAERERALQLEPLSLIVNFELGLAFYYERDYDKAIEQFQKTIALDQTFPAPHNFLPAAYEQKRMYSEAITEFKKSVSPTRVGESSMSQGGLGHVYAVAGRKDEARKILDELTEASKHQYVSPNSIALIYAGLGENDQAFDWLNKGYEQRAFQMQWMNVEPRWDNLRSDHRFAELIRRMGFPE